MSAPAATREPPRPMPSSSSSSSASSSSSSSSDDDVDDPDYGVDSSSDDVDYRAATPDDDSGNDAADGGLSKPSDAKSAVSSLRTQEEVDAVCKKYGVPNDQYTARPAGDLRASSSPPPGALCVCAHALEAGMRVPLHPFFCDVLAHFSIAPTQLAPNGWRIMAGFVVLCRCAGVPLSLAVFRHFFLLAVLKHKRKGLYFFRCKHDSGLRFTGLPDSIQGWKQSFFFLSSPTRWPCPVEWGEPSKSSFMAPELTGEEKRSVATLLRVHGGAPVDIRTYLLDNSLAAAKISLSSPAPPPPPPSPSCTPTAAGSKGMDPSVYSMLKSIMADKAAAAQMSASANKVKNKPGSDAPLSGKKRSLDEACGEGGPLPNNPPAAHGNSVPVGMRSPPPGFSQNRTRFPRGQHYGDITEWEAARDLLRGAVAPRQDCVFAASRPSDVFASGYVAVLKALNYAAFSLRYALELEEKLAARDAEVAVLQDKVEKVQAALEEKLAARDAEVAALQDKLEKVQAALR